MHLKKTYRMPNSIEVVEYNSARCPGESRPRRKKEKPTPERVKRNNQRRKQRECSRMIETYFNEDDCVFTLTFRKELRPASMEEALAEFKKLIRYLKREYTKRFYELFWIRNIEVGSRGAWHIHLVVNRIEGTEWMVESWWFAKYGAVYTQHLKSLQDKGHDIGEYISKTAVSSANIVESSWNHSRNIKKVEGETKKIQGHRMKDKPRVPQGWYLDKDSYYEGENADGYPFRTYILRRISRKRIDSRMKPAKIRQLQKKKGGKCRKKLRC